MDAREQLRTAHELFVAIGADGFAERARHELLATGETVRKRRDDTRDDLTPQEEHIARLAVAGRTNPEIGAELFISPRTVEWHLKKVFMKLGITLAQGPARRPARAGRRGRARVAGRCRPGAQPGSPRVRPRRPEAHACLTSTRGGKRCNLNTPSPLPGSEHRPRPPAPVAPRGLLGDRVLVPGRHGVLDGAERALRAVRTPGPLAPLTITVVYAVYVTGVTTSLLLAGHVSDWYGRKAVLIPALIVAAVGAVLFITWQSLAGLLVARVLTGLALGATVATATAYIADLDAGRTAQRRAVRRSWARSPTSAASRSDRSSRGCSRATRRSADAPVSSSCWSASSWPCCGRTRSRGPPAAPPLPRYRPQRLEVPGPGPRPVHRGDRRHRPVVRRPGDCSRGSPAGSSSGPLHHPSPALTGAAIFINFGVGVFVQITTAAWPARRLLAAGIPAILVGLAVLVASAWTAPPSLALFLAGGLLTGTGASAIFRQASASSSRRRARRPRRSARDLLHVGYAALSLPVLGLGVTLEYLSPRVTLLVFALVVGAGVLAAAPTLLRRPPRSAERRGFPGPGCISDRGVPRVRRLRAKRSTSPVHQPTRTGRGRT